MGGLLCTFTFSLLQGSPIYGPPIGHWAMGMAGECAHVCPHPPLTLVPLCRCQRPRLCIRGVLALPPASRWVLAACLRMCVGASSPFAHIRKHQWPTCACTWALVPPLCMRPFASCVCGLRPGTFPPSRKGWRALVYYLYCANLPCHFWSMYSICPCPD